MIDNGALYKKIEAREQLLATVSHDLRNPLSSIHTTAGMLRRKPAGDRAEAMRTVTLADRIIDAANHMNRLIDDLMDFTRLRSGDVVIHAAPWPVLQLLDEAKELFAPLTLPKCQTLEVREVVDGLVLHCDKVGILRVLANCVGSAIKFSPHNSTIVLDCEAVSGGLLFTVTDQGPGIEEQELPNIFDCFWQGKQHAGGLGLGLNIAKSLVEAHGGKIWAASLAQGGARISFMVPTQTLDVDPGRDSDHHDSAYDDAVQH